MRGKLRLLLRHVGLKLRLVPDLARPVAVLELAELVDARQEVRRRHLRPGFVRNRHFRLPPGGELAVVRRAVEGLDDLRRRHLGPHRPPRQLLRGDDEDRGVPYGNGRLVGQHVDAPVHQVHPRRVARNVQEREVGPLVFERVTGPCVRIPDDVDRPGIPLEPGDRQLPAVHLPRLDADRVHLVVEVRVDVLHREEAWAAVDGLLERV